MDGFLITAALFGIISLLALYMIVRAIMSFIREGKHDQEEQAPAAPRAVMTAMPKPAQAPAKPQAAPAQAPQSDVAAEIKEDEKTKEPAATIETKPVEDTSAVEPAKAEAELVTAVEDKPVASVAVEAETKTDDGAAKADKSEKAKEPEIKHPPIKPQEPNGESEKRVAEIQDILGKHI